MSFDIFSIFKSAPAAAPATPQPGQTNPNVPTGAANPGQPLPGTAATPGTAPNGMVPEGAANPPVSPLDAHKDIWQTPKTDPATSNPPSIFASLDPKKVMESAASVDFAKVVTPEMLQKVSAGGQDAISAFQQSLNSVAQNVYAQSAMATAKIVEQALEKQQERYDAALPNLVKKFSTNENLMTENPLLTNPAIQPLVGALQEQLIRKNPNASSTEIQKQVNDYFNALGATFAPKPAATPASRAASKETDWSSFLQ